MSAVICTKCGAFTVQQCTCTSIRPGDYVWTGEKNTDRSENARLVLENARLSDRVAELEALAPDPRVAVAIKALNVLARLGNEPYYGNSMGNVVAIDALKLIAAERGEGV